MPATTGAAVLWEVGGDWQIEDDELDDPTAGDVLVKMAVAGMCHSDEHAVTGDLPLGLPALAGSDGAGFVEAVAPRVTHLRPSDHVPMSFLPACARAQYCPPSRQPTSNRGRAR